ncbi:flotillin-1 [Elysia marginata]|uniref:Flotillin-1 n=1 Tax=Elysia marginata TaxID=1093978 RepID=A0AAV4G0Z7_9GAST|nr:flotillin-1 [Elysia marginata]
MGFVRCEPSEVLVVSGCCYERSRFIIDGRVFVWPSVQQVQRLPASVMSLSIENLKAHSNNGIQVTVVALAQDIYQDRKKFSQAVFEKASTDLINMGIQLVSYGVDSVVDEEVNSMNTSAWDNSSFYSFIFLNT